MGGFLNSAYEGYLLDCWRFSESIAKKMGSSSNDVVVAVFNKVASPYHFFKHNKEV